MVMMKRTLRSLALATGCVIALTVPAAQAQTLDSQIVMYDRLLELNPAYRESRIIKECGHIINAHLQAGCVEGVLANDDRRSMDLRDGLTGGSRGRMNPIDRTFQGPEIYGPRFGR
jgi:hypothetical protein